MCLPSCDFSMFRIGERVLDMGPVRLAGKLMVKPLTEGGVSNPLAFLSGCFAIKPGEKPRGVHFGSSTLPDAIDVSLVRSQRDPTQAVEQEKMSAFRGIA